MNMKADGVNLHIIIDGNRGDVLVFKAKSAKFWI